MKKALVILSLLVVTQVAQAGWIITQPVYPVYPVVPVTPVYPVVPVTPVYPVYPVVPVQPIVVRPAPVIITYPTVYYYYRRW